jgi:hypothetical protein
MPNGAHRAIITPPTTDQIDGGRIRDLISYLVEGLNYPDYFRRKYLRGVRCDRSRDRVREERVRVREERVRVREDKNHDVQDSNQDVHSVTVKDFKSELQKARDAAEAEVFRTELISNHASYAQVDKGQMFNSQHMYLPTEADPNFDIRKDPYAGVVNIRGGGLSEAVAKKFEEDEAEKKRKKAEERENLKEIWNENLEPGDDSSIEAKSSSTEVDAFANFRMNEERSYRMEEAEDRIALRVLRRMMQKTRPEHCALSVYQGWRPSLDLEVVFSHRP